MHTHMLQSGRAAGRRRRSQCHKLSSGPETLPPSTAPYPTPPPGGVVGEGDTKMMNAWPNPPRPQPAPSPHGPYPTPYTLALITGACHHTTPLGVH